MEWNHPRNESKAEHKKRETKSGTDWSFIAAMIVAA